MIMKMMAFRLSIPLYLAGTIPGRFPASFSYNNMILLLSSRWFFGDLMVNNSSILSACNSPYRAHLRSVNSYQLA